MSNCHCDAGDKSTGEVKSFIQSIESLEEGSPRLYQPFFVLTIRSFKTFNKIDLVMYYIASLLKKDELNLVKLSYGDDFFQTRVGRSGFLKSIKFLLDASFILRSNKRGHYWVNPVFAMHSDLGTLIDIGGYVPEKLLRECKVSDEVIEVVLANNRKIVK